jgi:CRP-like cAMP-binding protein
MVPWSFAPGTVIIRQGEPSDNLYIITRGQVEVLIQRDRGEQMVVTTMDRGQYFGEIELLHGGRAIATIRASMQTGVDAAVLDRSTFQRLVAQSETARIAIDRVAETREAENVAARSGRS